MLHAHGHTMLGMPTNDAEWNQVQTAVSNHPIGKTRCEWAWIGIEREYETYAALQCMARN